MGSWWALPNIGDGVWFSVIPWGAPDYYVTIVRQVDHHAAAQPGNAWDRHTGGTAACHAAYENVTPRYRGFKSVLRLQYQPLSALCGACAGILGERGLGLVVSFRMRC